MDEAVRRDVEALQQAKDFLVAQLHAVAGIVGACVEERRGVDRLDVEPVLRQQHLHQRELIVDLVVGVGVEHHAHLADRRLQEFEAGCVRECHHRLLGPGVPIADQALSEIRQTTSAISSICANM